MKTEMSAKIQVLDTQTSNKIAAGEVVERPASVVKELIENAIDAKSTKIEIEIMAGGTSFIRVTDNGAGMGAEDAKLSILRHATSKLRTASDLNRIETLGFRGEALPTIAAVSRFSLLTRPMDAELATLVEVKGGEVQDTREAGGGVGTTVKVEDLFFNTPARKKFLKTPVSEGSHINESIVKLAIANPAIAFKFINNNKLVLSTPGSGDLRETLRSLYGAKVGDELLLLDFADEDVGVRGFLSKPTVLRSSRQWQTLVVNGRVIGSRALSKALDNAYQSLLPKSGYPLAVLYIDVPINSIDVNVHPQKSEIKFADEGRIFKAVYKTVRDAIQTPEPLADIAAPVRNLERHYIPMELPVLSDPVTPLHTPKPTHVNTNTNAPPYTPRPYTPPELPRVVRENNVSFAEARAELAKRSPAPMPSPTSASDEAPIPAYGGELQPLGQIDRCYIVAQGAEGLYIVDQHAAHERILYDRFARMTEEIPSQQLLVHLFLEFNETECALIAEQRELFAELGFSMEQSGPQTVRLKEIPSDIPIGEAEAIIREILESLQNLHAPSAQEIRHACLAITACKAAIKAGDMLNVRQMQILLDELGATALPYTCPHGRPSIIKFTSGELAKMFKRT